MVGDVLMEAGDISWLSSKSGCQCVRIYKLCGHGLYLYSILPVINFLQSRLFSMYVNCPNINFPEQIFCSSVIVNTLVFWQKKKLIVAKRRPLKSKRPDDAEPCCRCNWSDTGGITWGRKWGKRSVKGMLPHHSLYFKVRKGKKI